MSTPLFETFLNICSSGPCREGHYCLSGAETATPTNSTTGDKCPAGFYCPNATAIPFPCDDGEQSKFALVEL